MNGARAQARLDLERLARLEAELMALEAQIDQLLLQHGEAATKYAEAAARVEFDPELCSKYTAAAAAARSQVFDLSAYVEP